MIDRINKRWILITAAFVMAFVSSVGMTALAKDSNYTKQENVYVISDASGQISKTIVGVNIKNYDKLKEIEDISDPSDIGHRKEVVELKS